MPQSVKPITVGSQIKVSFPQFGISDVPAKVDTGADSSSIWASNIKERGGKLTYSLFGPGSAFYTGEIINTKNYQIRSFKNSFGQTEFRYKVNLKVKVEDRLINVRLSLANRAENKYPILIGKRTLHGRFLVDVSLTPQQDYRVLVIRSHSSNATKASEKFFKDLKKDNRRIKFTHVGLDDLEFMVNDTGSQVIIANKKIDLADFDMVYFRTIHQHLDIAAVVAQYLQQKNVAFADRAILKYHQSVNKLQQMILLQNAGIKVPLTMFVLSEKLPDSYVKFKSGLGLPFLLKDIHGKKGRNLFLIKNKADYDKACVKIQKREIEVLAHQFISHEGHYKILVFGKRIELVIFLRHKLSEPRLNKKVPFGQSALVDETALPGKVREAAIRAAESLTIDIAGVDMFKDKNTGSWYCLEVNENPQLVTGAFTDDKKDAFSEFLDSKLNR